MRLLIDTNIFLEIILEQEHAEEAKRLFAGGKSHDFFLTDFSMHSIGLLLFRRSQPQIFQQFLLDTILSGVVILIAHPIEGMEAVAESAKKWNLDFDDAYQYATAGTFDLTIVSFDADFDRTDRGRKTPGDIIRQSGKGP